MCTAHNRAANLLIASLGSVFLTFGCDGPGETPSADVLSLDVAHDNATSLETAQGPDGAEQDTPDTGKNAPDTGQDASDFGQDASDTGQDVPDTGQDAPPPSDVAPSDADGTSADSVETLACIPQTCAQLQAA